MWKFSLLILLLFACMAARPPTAQAVTSVRIYVLVPSDNPGFVSAAEGVSAATQFAEMERAWLMREVGKTFDYTVTLAETSHAASYFGSNGDETSTPDACGEYGVPGSGAGRNHVWEVLSQDFGMPDTGTQRIWIYVLGGGGSSAGEHFGSGQLDYGRAIMGDWGMYRLLHGQPIPCDPMWYPMSLGVAVETGHTMAIDSENPLLCLELTLPCSFMTSGQKRDLKNHNKAFLY